MNLYIKDIGEGKCACDALILPVTEDGPGDFSEFGASVSKLLKKVTSLEFRGAKDENLLIPAPEDVKPSRLLLAGLGKAADVSSESLRRAGGKAMACLRNAGIRKAALSTRAISALNLSPTVFVEGGLLGLYSFTRYKQERDDKTVKELTVLARPSQELETGLSWTGTVASAVSFCRDLVNTPANDMTPKHLAAAALALKKRNLSVEVLEEKAVRRLGMGAYLSVAKGSDEPLKFIVLDYRGAKKPPVVLIGKAVTFDSGGISLKPSDGMEKMKYDMAGGAAVLGVVKAAAEARLPLRVVGIVPATENLPGGSASRPGDVVKTIGGKTVEIISTDAEGRMALADAIGYARRFHPAAVIDIATLTGACSIALGNEAVAMMGNDKALMDRLRDAGANTYERVWEMPLFDEYGDYLKSDIADLKNTGGRSGSLVSSGYFLKEFAEDMPWAHLDIAGTAWVEKDKPHMPKGASGVGVRLLLDVLKGME